MIKLNSMVAKIDVPKVVYDTTRHVIIHLMMPYLTALAAGGSSIQID